MAEVPDPELPNFVLAISAREAITGGIAGNLGRTRDGGATWTWERLGDSGNWLICASRDRAGRVWIGQQEGRVWRAAHARAPFEEVANVRGSVNTVRQISETQAVMTEKTAYRLDLKRATIKRDRLFESRQFSMIDGAIDDRGRIVIVANRGKGWFAADGERFDAIDLRAGTLDFDAVFWVDGWFTVLGYDGNLRVSHDGTTWKRFEVEPKSTVRRLGGIAMYRGGWLVGGTRDTPQLEGTLAYFGNPAVAPVLPTPPPATADGLNFVLAERYALLWATDWASLPDAQAHADGWMKLAAKLA